MNIKKKLPGLKKHKLLILLLLIVLIALSGLLIVRNGKKSREDIFREMPMETATIEKRNLTNSISVTGTIASAEQKSVNTSLKDMKVTAVYAAVGDKVEKGDVICTFDSADIEKALADAKNNYSVNQKLEALDNYETQYTDSIAQAEAGLQSMRDKRDDAKNAYQDAEDVKNSAKAVYDQTVAELEKAVAEYEAVKETDAAESEKYKEAEKAYETASAAEQKAKASYEQAEAAAMQAEQVYEQAQSAREEYQETYENSLEQAEKTYEKAKLQNQLVNDADERNKIEEYEEQLENCTVYAAMSGTITSLSVEEGNVFAGGTIYEIEDFDHFIVKASVDEYDICDLEKGMTAYIRTDSTGDEELSGTLTYVAAAGTSGNQTGAASSASSYEIQIAIDGTSERLRSGMTAKASISLEESKDALTVPYDCVQNNAQGESIIYIDKNGEKKEVVVETGIETDYYTEVISDELREGMTVYLSTPLIQSNRKSYDNTGEKTPDMSFRMGGAPAGGSAPAGAPGGF